MERRRDLQKFQRALRRSEARVIAELKRLGNVSAPPTIPTWRTLSAAERRDLMTIANAVQKRRGN
jgi:hypothetical protein